MTNLKRALAASALMLAAAAAASAQFITSDVVTRVFHLKAGEGTGSAFTIEVKDRQYLITARHVVRGIKDGDSISIFHGDRWREVPVKVLYPVRPDVDVAVLALPFQLSPVTPIRVGGIVDVILSQEVYFLGYPFGLWMGGQTLNRGFPVPFVKKGIVSALFNDVAGPDFYYLDAINNPGFSGGPVVVRQQASAGPLIIGVVSGFRSQEAPVSMRGVPSTELVAHGNSGLLLAFGLRGALEVIEKNPIGFPIKK